MKSLINLFRNNPIILFIIAVFIFFYPFFIQRKIPIPADTIVGMYHPWRDAIWDRFTAGVPFKNFLITDPVRQQYVWRNLSIEEIKNGKLPFWNSYSFSGTPFLANFQGATFYPLNIIFFILPFDFAWGILIFLQPLLAGIFLYSYLRFFDLNKHGCVLGALVFAFSGFSIAWLEWNTIGHVILWLPLILLSIEKIIIILNYHAGLVSASQRSRNKFGMTEGKRLIIWSLVLIFSLVSSFFAGHLQVFFYCQLLIITYLIIRSLTLTKKRISIILLFVLCYLLSVIITSIQWLPTLELIFNSARSIDQGSWTKEGWFIPWQNLVQFLVPDFFGNPATGNYWGIWNYGEFTGYIGIIPLIFTLYALLFRHDKKTLFFGILVLASLVFALPTPLAKLPYKWQIPFISTSQPTRLLAIVDFSLAILTALGFDYFLKNKSSMVQIIKLLGLLGIIYGIIWLLVLTKGWLFFNLMDSNNLLVAKRNLILPTIIFILGSGSLLGYIFMKNNRLKLFFVFCSLFFVLLDLFRFGWKFTPFVKDEWIFPSTKITEILRHNTHNYRIMSLDRRIMPPNFSVFYKLQDVSGYDPLYLINYTKLVSAWERDKPDVTLASFNRIVTPANYKNFITDLLGVKYLLSLAPLESERLRLITSEGSTYLYENKDVFPRAFLVEEVIQVEDEQREIEEMFLLKDRLRNIAVTTESIKLNAEKLGPDEVSLIDEYGSSYVRIKTKTNIERLLVLTDIYYPSWRVYVDGKEEKVIETDFALRGVIVPSGDHTIVFNIKLI